MSTADMGEVRYTVYHPGMKMFYRGTRGAGRGSGVRWADSLHAAYFASFDVAQTIAWRFEGAIVRTNHEMYESGLSVKLFVPES